MLPRLDELEADLLTRRDRAQAEGWRRRLAQKAGAEGWLGELEGIDLTLAFLGQKREQAQRRRHPDVFLGMPNGPRAIQDPTTPPPTSSARGASSPQRA